ncbi:maltose-binding protein [Vibrio sp. 03-59-1]|uniref:MalM family protein n=1 Tax=Vibrio sp. 03-59-1 TaxID=2607607 RepID=UPI0014939242|nr:MalM family protein [Vibrio sp. 03-59-1]NOH82412.1 maltose-binding protein [Vibrio sp. 03-59-1]
MNKKTWFALLGLLFVSGCSSTQHMPNNVGSKDVQVISNVKDVQWNHVDIPSSFLFTFSTETQYLSNDKFETPISGFSFDNHGVPITLEINSPIAQLSVFTPSVVVYDQNMQIIKQYSSNAFDYDKNDFVKGAMFSGEVELNLPLSVSKAFVMIYTTQDDLRETTTILHPAKAMAISKRNDPPAIEDPIASHSKYGTVSVVLKTRSGFSLFSESKSPSAPIIPESNKIKNAAEVQPETETYYYDAIKKAVANDDLPKALSLLDEAKALNVENVQQVFIKAINEK